MNGFRWLKREVAKDDVAVVYISTHGGMDEDGFVICNVGTLVHGKDIRKALGGVNCKVCLYVDTCSAGGILKTPETIPSNLYILCSCLEKESSFSLDTKRSFGMFGKALVEGMNGKADLNHDGFVTLDELERYVWLRSIQLSEAGQHAVYIKPKDFIGIRLAQP